MTVQNEQGTMTLCGLKEAYDALALAGKRFERSIGGKALVGVRGANLRVWRTEPWEFVTLTIKQAENLRDYLNDTLGAEKGNERA